MDLAAEGSLLPGIVGYLPLIGITFVFAWIVTAQLLPRRTGASSEAGNKQSLDEGVAPQKGSDNKKQQQQGSGANRSGAVTTTKKKQSHQAGQEKWAGGRDSKQHNFSHEWLLTSLKGHTAPVLDMSFSANGKFLATCAEDDPGGTSGSSSGSEGNKENNSPATGRRGDLLNNNKHLSRRQKKNRVRSKEDSGSPHPNKKKQPAKKQTHTILRQYAKLNLSEAELFAWIKRYSLSHYELFNHGYPLESKLYPGCALIYKCVANPPTQFDINAKEFYPRDESVYISMLVRSDTNTATFEKCIGGTPTRRTDTGALPEEAASLEKKCVRCLKCFFISASGEYLTQERCFYHWGKLMRDCSGEAFYSCCKGLRESGGCSTGKLHVWSGVGPGQNGPFDGYVRTRPRKTPPPDGNYGVYALDCEMCFTTLGLELTKLTVVSLDGRLVYDTYVRPESFIIDYNTRFSGVTAKDFDTTRKPVAKSLKEVQNDLMGFVSADTILIGHALENDLRALRMIHTKVVDTAVVFPHFKGLPFRRSLKSLVSTILKRDIQTHSSGHDPCEDARSCLELILWKIRKDRVAFNYSNIAA